MWEFRAVHSSWIHQCAAPRTHRLALTFRLMDLGNWRLRKSGFLIFFCCSHQVFLQAGGTLCTDASALLSHARTPSSAEHFFDAMCFLDWKRSDQGPYILGTSTRSASASLYGVASTWSAAIDASSLIPGRWVQQFQHEHSLRETQYYGFI